MKLKTVCLCLITLLALLSPAAHAQTFSVIHAFQGPEGAGPEAGVTLRGGVLYGTTGGGGLECIFGQPCGTVYQIRHVGSNWITTAISLLGRGSVLNPESRVVFGPDEHLYGTESLGVSNGGLVFDLIPPVSICKTAACLWTENILHTFTGPPDGDTPHYGDLIWDQQGNIYGTTGGGGTADRGTVFQMTKSGDNWTETPIYSFLGSPDGEGPLNAVIFDSGGNLLGTANQGGASGFGTVFKLIPSGNMWIETNVYDFQGGNDGESPIAGLMIDGSGDIYGATSDGGSGGGGTVFELTPLGNSYTFELLYAFSEQQERTCGPWGTLTMDTAGNLYGTTRCDGANNLGNIFTLTNTENGWTYTSLHDFTGGDDGANPTSNVTIDTDGTLYGTASLGGANSIGTVWMIKP